MLNEYVIHVEHVINHKDIYLKIYMYFIYLFNLYPMLVLHMILKPFAMDCQHHWLSLSLVSLKPPISLKRAIMPRNLQRQGRLSSSHQTCISWYLTTYPQKAQLWSHHSLVSGKTTAVPTANVDGKVMVFLVLS